MSHNLDSSKSRLIMLQGSFIGCMAREIGHVLLVSLPLSSYTVTKRDFSECWCKTDPQENVKQMELWKTVQVFYMNMTTFDYLLGCFIAPPPLQYRRGRRDPNSDSQLMVGLIQNKAKRFAKQQQSNVEMLWLAYIAISCKQSKLVEEIIKKLH